LGNFTDFGHSVTKSGGFAMSSHLPALKIKAGSGLPVVVVDSREQTPLEFRRLASRVGTLATGDYSFVGGEDDFAVERKSIADLVGSLTAGRDRFLRELQRMQAFPFRRLLIVGQESDIVARRYRSNANPTAIMHGLHAIEARGVPVVFAATPYEAAQTIERWAVWRARAILNLAGKIELSPELVPGVSDCATPSEKCDTANSGAMAVGSGGGLPF
jgi:DNA excision repair protein ERCC-4